MDVDDYLDCAKTFATMGDDIDDGINPDICDEGGLGFSPQRRNLSNNLLPYGARLDVEIASQLTSIKTNIVQAVALSDIRYGTLYWINKLHRFIKLYSYCFSKTDHIAFVKLLFELVITPREDVWVTLRIGSTLMLLLKKVSLLTPDDLELPWRPLFELHKKLFHNAQAYQNMLHLPQQCESTFNTIIRYCRAYFGPGTTEELLEEFIPKMCPFDEHMGRSMKYLDLFLPIVRRHGGRPPNHHLWRPLLLDMVRNSPYWEPTALGVLARLAWKNMGYIDWEDELSLVFTKVLRSLKLPVGYRGMTAYMTRSFDSTYVAMFIVANLGGGSSCQEHLARFIGVVESYLHPSNVGCWTNVLMELLNRITLHFNKRINREHRHSEGDSWECVAVPEHKRLVEADVGSFVECLLPVTLTALFGRTGTNDAAMVLSRLATHRTELVMTKYLDLMYPALTSSTEPIRLHACLQAGVLTARPLVTGGSDFPSGPTHVLPLLKLLLPGIDPNDISKTMSTFQLVTTYATLIPLADCSDAPQKMDLTEVEVELCQQSGDLCDFLLVFLERCLSVVESCVSAQHQSSQHAAPHDSSAGSSGGPGMSKEETLLEAGMAFTIRGIFQQAHPDIAKALVRRLATYVIGRTLETGVSGRLLSNICRAVAKAQPALLLAALVPPLTRLLVSLTASEAVQKEERPDCEIMFNLLILSEIMTCRADVAIQYVPAVIPVLRQCLKLVCISAQLLAVSLLGNTLSALATTTTVDYKSITHEWDEPYEDFLPVRHWGALLPGGWRNMKVQWVEPGPEQREAVSDLLHTFVLPELSKLDAASKDLASLTKEQLQQSLHIVQEGLNAGPLLPFWDEEPIQLREMLAPFAAPALTLASSPQTVQFTAPGRPTNVRRAIAETVLRLADAMVLADSDNTKAYNSIVNILWCVSLLHSIKRSDFDGRWRTLSQVQRLLRNNLVGPHQHWHHVRHVMVQRANLQHLSRTLEFVEAMPFTATHREIMNTAMRLSTTNYSQVRRGGQQLLRNIFAQFPASYRLLLPDLKHNLALDPLSNHKAFKGTLYVILGGKGQGVAVRRDWRVLSELWPAMLTTEHSEKPSIATLLTQLIDQIVKYTEMFCITQQFPDRLAQEVTRAGEAMGVPVAPDTVEVGRARIGQEAAANLQLYSKLVHSIASQLESGKLQWRFEQMGACMLGALIRTDVTFPAEAVRCLTNTLVHPNTNVRKLGIYYLSTILRSQKRPHKKLLVDPLSLEPGREIVLVNGSAAGQGKVFTGPPEDIMRPSVDRPDNRWLQYDPSSKLMTEERYNSRRFVNPSYLGFTVWPKSVSIYAPFSEQPPLDRPVEELPPQEREIHNFFWDNDKLEKLIGYLSLEDYRERFDGRKMMLWKGLFRNFGPSLLPLVRPHLEKLAADTNEASQRCASEITAGLSRANKHWPHKDWHEANALVLATFTTAFTKMSAEASDNWYRALTRMSMDRDPNLVADIVEMLLDLPDLPTSSSFTLQCRLLLCSTLLGQQEWRIMSVLQRLLERLTPALSHPYKSVRDRISALLFCVFSQGTGLFYDGTCGVKMDNSLCPDLDKFVEYVLGELGSLQEYSGGNSSDGGSKALLAAAASSQHSTVAAHHHLVPGVEAMVAAHEVTQDKPGHEDTEEDGGGDGGGDGSDHRRHQTTSLEEVVTAHDDDNNNTDDQIIEESSQESVVYSSEAASSAAGAASGVAPAGEKGNRGVEVVGGGDDAPLQCPSFDCVAGETDERKNAFRIINTMCSFIEIICSRNHYSTPPPLYKMLGALCQLESVDSEQEVCSNCVSALCVIGQTLVRQQDILPLLHRIQDISRYRWWRARSAALGVLQMVVFHNALNMMACEGASELILRTVLDRLTDERVEVRSMAAQVLASLLHIAFVKNKDEVRNTFISTLRKKLQGSWSSRPSEAWSIERLVAVHGAVLGLTAFVESAPYTVPSFMPEVLCMLANYINLPQPIAGSIRDSLSNFRRTHHDNWQEHKQNFTIDQLDMLNELLLSPSYYA